MAPADSPSCPSGSTSSSSSRRSSWAALLQKYEDAMEYRDDDAMSDVDHDQVTAQMSQLGIEETSVPASGGRVNNPELQTIVETMSLETAIQVPQVAIDNSNIQGTDSESHEQLKPHGPFYKWMRTIHRRARHRSTLSDGSINSLQPRLEPEIRSRTPTWKRSHHRQSSSGSSFAFVSAVRSASASLASVSAVARSRKTITRSQGFSVTERSSRASMTGPRASEDSSFLESHSLADLAVIERSLQRRKVLEELISTEEGYIGDIRFLMNVYVTILAALPSICVGLRSSINQNLTEIVKLHEELLGELHRAVPHSEYTQVNISPTLTPFANPNCLHTHSHRRWSSLGAVPEQNMKARWLLKAPGMLADPQVAAEVAKVFAKKINMLFIYEEYGATYEMMIKDIGAAQQAMPNWETYQKGLEALAMALGSSKGSEEGVKKALTINDLLVKPIQRICKYPLLFSELLKCTPISDCPNSHMEIDDTLTRLREATSEINRASNNEGIKSTLEKTWILQDRLAFPDRKLDAVSKKQIRSFGHIRLCGVLHVCWQTNDGVDGQYFICLLYRHVLCLASAGKVDPIYTIVACISIDDIRIEEVDNGRGIQCHTAPFSWKLVFECDHQLCELIMTACTPKEEMKWKSRLARPAREDQELRSPDIFSSLHINVKSLGTVFGKPGTLARRISIQRATTVGAARPPLCQVILKNTNVLRDHSSNSSAALAVNRSHSLLATTTRIPVLAPPRGERARLEALLSDVWSREVLPFPRMTVKSRGENLVRSSASTVIRKLSVASFASSFTKRSASSTQKIHPSENTTMETTKRWDIKNPGEPPLPDDVSLGEESGRKAKRQRTTKEGTAIITPAHSMKKATGSVRRREVRDNKIPKRGIASDMHDIPTRMASTNISLPVKSASSRVTVPLPVDMDNTRKSSTEKIRNLGLWSKIGGGGNDAPSSFKRLLTIGRN
ncbi:hypothetical protein FP744_10008965 [Trichoderma asperellum]|nr:Dbl homology domain-containing protein [Trichoderma asperelloides]